MTKLIPLLLLPCLCEAAQFIDLPDIGNNSYLNARYLNHTTGRFLTQDDKKQFKSHYVYGNGRIIKTSDPSGNMFGHFFSPIETFSRVETNSAMEMLVKESTTIVIPHGGTIDTKMVVRDSNNVIVSRGNHGRQDITNIFPPSYNSIIPEIEHPYRRLPNPHIRTQTETLYLNPSRDESPPSYGSINYETPAPPYSEVVQGRIHRVRYNSPVLRRAGTENAADRIERLLSDFEHRVGIFSDNPMDRPMHHNDYNSFSSPTGDNLEYDSNSN